MAGDGQGGTAPEVLDLDEPDSPGGEVALALQSPRAGAALSAPPPPDLFVGGGDGGVGFASPRLGAASFFASPSAAGAAKRAREAPPDLDLGERSLQDAAGGSGSPEAKRARVSASPAAGAPASPGQNGSWVGGGNDGGGGGAAAVAAATAAAAAAAADVDDVDDENLSDLDDDDEIIHGVLDPNSEAARAKRSALELAIREERRGGDGGGGEDDEGQELAVGGGLSPPALEAIDGGEGMAHSSAAAPGAVSPIMGARPAAGAAMHHTVDLTGDDDEDDGDLYGGAVTELVDLTALPDDVKNEYGVRAPTAAAAAAARAKAEPRASDEDLSSVGDDDMERDVAFGSFRSDLVGSVSFVSVVVNHDEEMVFARDAVGPGPSNIRVHNVVGSQIGYLEPQHARLVSPLLYRKMARVEVTVNMPATADEIHHLRRQNISIPLHVTLYGAPEHCAEVQRFMQLLPGVLNFHPGLLRVPLASGAGGAANPVYGGMDGAGGVGGVGGEYYAGDYGGPSVDEIENDMEKLLLASVDMDCIPKEPPKFMRTELRPFQRQGLWWMVQRENNPGRASKMADRAAKALAEARGTSAGGDEDAEDGGGGGEAAAERGKSSSSSSSAGGRSGAPGGGKEAKREPVSAEEAAELAAKAAKAAAVPGEDSDSEDDLPPFWEKQTDRFGNSVFYNRVSRSTVNEPPSHMRGGILADEMGLGKTIQVIALIMSNSGKRAGDKRLVPLPSSGGRKKKKKKGRGGGRKGAAGKRKKKKKKRSGRAAAVHKKKEAKKKGKASQKSRSSNDIYGSDSEDEDEEEEDDYDDDDDDGADGEAARGRSRRRRAAAAKQESYYVSDSESESDHGQDFRAGGRANGADDDDEWIAGAAEEGEEEDDDDDDASDDDDDDDDDLNDSDGVSNSDEDDDLDEELDSDDDVLNDASYYSAVGIDPSDLPGPASGPTLIVVPVSVITNWQDQFITHTLPGSVTIYTYHGPKRERSAEHMQQYDVVITTFSIMRREFSESDEYLEAKEAEEKAKADRKLKRAAQDLALKQITQDQYKEIEAEAKKMKRRGKSRESPLFKTRWLRVVLDEAHVIREAKTTSSKAAHALHAERRWCLTGTPLQNKINDVFALMRFLRMHPFDHHQWWSRLIMRPIKNRQKQGVERLRNLMASVTLRRKKSDKLEGKPILDIKDKYEKVIEVQLSEEEQSLYDLLALTAKSKFRSLLREGSVLSHYAFVLEMLLRMRQACDHMDLVPNRYYQRGFEAIDDDKVARLRRLLDLLEDMATEECSICMSVMEEPAITQCGHAFCISCIEAHFDANPRTCPLCREAVATEDGLVTRDMAQALQLADLRDKMGKGGDGVGGGDEDDAGGASALMRDYLNGETAVGTSSSKITKLLQMIREERVTEPDTKVVVFSQWTSMLDKIQDVLEARSIGFVRLDGRMRSDQRQQSLRTFRDDPDVYVFLISLAAGGVGLNLTTANLVFLVDPWWNPAAEDQAVDRVHRMGQEKKVKVYRLVIEDSVEQRVIDLQQKKRDMITEVMQGVDKKKKKSREQLQRERVRDLKYLFGAGGRPAGGHASASSSAAAAAAAAAAGAGGAGAAQQLTAQERERLEMERQTRQRLASDEARRAAALRQHRLMQQQQQQQQQLAQQHQLLQQQQQQLVQQQLMQQQLQQQLQQQPPPS